MEDKLHDYQGFTGRLHQWRDNVKEKISSFREQNPGNIVELAKNTATGQLKGNVNADQDYSHIYRLVRLKSKLIFEFGSYSGIQPDL